MSTRRTGTDLGISLHHIPYTTREFDSHMKDGPDGVNVYPDSYRSVGKMSNVIFTVCKEKYTIINSLWF